MQSFLMRYGTPLTVGLFLVSTVSGVALFLGWQPGVFHEMHEILSMVLIAPFLVHVWRNWRPFVAYFRHAAMPIALGVSVLAAGAFAYEGLSGTGRGGNPAFALVQAAEQAPLAALAPVLKQDAAALVERLTTAGYGPVTAEDTILTVATRKGAEPFAVIAALVQPAP